MEGTEAERAIDLRTLRSKTGYIAFDEGYGNTGSCESGITFINGEKGILRHRGYPIEQLAEQSSFLETAYLIIYGELPSEVALKAFERNILSNATLDGKMYPIFEGFHQDSHPMAMLSSIINSLCTYHSEYATNNRKVDLEHFDAASSILMSKARTIAAMIYRKKMGLPMMDSDPSKSYSEDFLSMLLSSQKSHTWTHAEHQKHSIYFSYSMPTMNKIVRHLPFVWWPPVERIYSHLFQRVS